MATEPVIYPEGFIYGAALEVVIAAGVELQPGDEVVLINRHPICTEFQNATIRLGPGRLLRTLCAPNDKGNYAMGFAHKDGTWRASWEDVAAWRRPR